MKAFVYEKKGNKRVLVMDGVECVLDDEKQILIVYNGGEVVKFDRKKYKATIYQN